MTKVYPNAAAAVSECVKPEVTEPELCNSGGSAVVLTVWRKSLLFNGNGFTVFDSKGNLVFRVDNYASGNKGEIVLMDATGKPLLNFRRKKLSLADHWLVYKGEEAANPKLSVKKNVNLLNPKALAQVTPCSGGPNYPWAYEVEGSYSRRCCVVYDKIRRRQMAEIKRKEAVGGVGFGLDVFRLVVQPGFDATVAMAIVILLEQMFGSRGSLIKG